ncbi:thioredoxin family protein [Aquabacterium sp.]|uniref:thioredoxin family protein n=1 Tax=Aquabacterium sp. TaxID=1872578 RepID=UPI003783A534
MSRLTLAARAAFLSLSLLATLPAAAAAGAKSDSGVAWLAAAGDADVDKAFAQARTEKKPVLLYWGAKWCPPCNQLKATLFNRQDFIERSKGFVAVNIDGDLPGAQKLGARFKVRGYPTLILMGADGTELTRLPGEADAPQVMALLQQGLAGGRPVKAVLADARAGKPLGANEWRALALYSWDTDQDQLVPEAERPGLLAELSAACPATEAESGTRLLLKSLAASDDGKGLKPDNAVRERVRKLLADPVASRAQMEMLVNYAPDITRALAPDAGADRQAIAAAFDAALQRLEGDASLSRADRLSALAARVDLARVDLAKSERHPKISAALLKQVREHAARADREITDGYERQAVITGAAYMLGQAGLWQDSDALLKANLARSHSPYYLMSQLAGNARKLGRKDEALRWYQQAFDKSEGPATRLQWGATYFTALVELAPQDAARIEKTAAQLFREAAQDKGAFYERSARSLQKVGSQLASWNAGGRHGAVLARLQQQLDGVCSRIEATDSQRGTCDALARSLARRA